MTKYDLFKAMGHADAKQIAAALGEISEPLPETAPEDKPVPVKPDKSMNPVWRWILTAGCAAACIGSAVLLMHFIPKDDYTYTQHSAEDIEVTRDSLHTETTAAVRSAGTDIQSTETEEIRQSILSEAVTEPDAEGIPGGSTAEKLSSSVQMISVPGGADAETSLRPSETGQQAAKSANRHLTADELIEKYAAYAYAEATAQIPAAVNAIVLGNTDCPGFPKQYRFYQKQSGTDTIVQSFRDCSCENGYYYYIMKDGNASIVGYDADAYLRTGNTVLRIPERIGGAAVTRIEDRAFQYIGRIFPGLTEIIMPDTVETVGIAAFQNMNGGYVQQTNAKIRLSQNLKAIQAYAFYQAEQAVSDEFGIIQLPDSLEFLGYNVFRNGYSSTVTGRSWNYLIQMPNTPVYIDLNCCQTDAAIVDHSTLADKIAAYDDPVLFFGQDMLDLMESQMTPEERQVLLDSYEANGKPYKAFAAAGLYDAKKQGVDAKNLYGGFHGGAFLYDECTIVSAAHPDTQYTGTPALFLPDWIVSQQKKESPEKLPETTTQAEAENLIQVTKPSREELLAKYGYLLLTEPSFNYIGGQYVEEEYPYRFEAHGDAAYMPKTGEVMRSGKADGFRFEILDTGKARINGLDDAEIDTKAETLIIPNTIDGCMVTEIGYRAFENCYKKMPALKEIRIPDSVEIIAEGAFCDAFNYDSCRSGSGENQKVPKFPEDIKINIPENVVFIGYEAYKYDISAISNAQNKDRIIHLPETLEYISCSALGCVYRRFQGGFEIDMPESLVCMSDYCFDQYYPHNGLTKRRYIKPTIGDVSEFREEDLPLIMNYINAGFYQGEQNIVTFGELYGATVVAQEQTANYWYGNPSSLVPDDKLEYHNITSLFAGAIADAAKYAPEYLPENVRAAMEQ